jgi:hypothetical protein
VLSARLIQLIETHSEVLTREVLQDLATNPRTRSFQMVLRVPLVAHRQPLPKSRRVGSDWARTYMLRPGQPLAYAEHAAIPRCGGSVERNSRHDP